MTPAAMVLMGLSWGLVLGLTFWCFRRVLRASERKPELPVAGGDAGRKR